MFLSLFRCGRLKVRVVLAFLIDHLQLVHLEEAAEGPVARLAVRFFSS